MPVKKVTVKKPTTYKPKKVVFEAKIPSEKIKTTGLSIDVFDIKGGKSTMTLPAEVFGVKVNKTLIAQAVRVYLANQRTGGAKAQTRGEVQGSTRKIYQQKGTGRARHGGIRAPIFVGGGVAHGPRPHDFTLAMPKKMRKQALFGALTSKKEEGAIKVVKGLSEVSAKTKAMVSVMKNIGLEKKEKNIVVVLPLSLEKTASLVKAARNIKGVTFMPVAQLNTYEVLKAHTMLFMQEAIAGLQFVKTKK